MSKKLEQNLSKVRDMLAGNNNSKIIVGGSSVGTSHMDGRQEGERWTDLEGKEWEKKNGIIKNVRRMPDVGIFSKKCKDCGRDCSRVHKKQPHFDTWKRFERCFYCQINYETLLKSKSIGENGNKWQFWVKLQMLQRWDAIDQEVQHLVFENSNVKHNDKALTNALANENQRQAREAVKKL
tara:strand:+ start:322 stop:864 length:543 start_codon:yes stop_codon:yes gene_type:complete